MSLGIGDLAAADAGDRRRARSEERQQDEDVRRLGPLSSPFAVTTLVKTDAPYRGCPKTVIRT
jgi:hypothetical protein